MKKLIISLFVLSISSIAVAQDAKPRKAKRTQKVTFEAQDIDGQVRTPEGAFLNPKKGAKFLPLYKVTNELDREIKNSVEFVR